MVYTPFRKRDQLHSGVYTKQNKIVVCYYVQVHAPLGLNVYVQPLCHIHYTDIVQRNIYLVWVCFTFPEKRNRKCLHKKHNKK